jgi:nitrate reductase NapE component
VNDSAQDDRRFNASVSTSVGSTWPVEELAVVAAYGEVVWSWHPLLMLSLAEI